MSSETRTTKRLNRILLETTLELICYQDTYDKMMSVNDIKNEMDKLKRLISNDKISNYDRERYKGAYATLIWVLNGSETKSEKLSKVAHSSKKEVINMIKDFNDKYYKQLSFEDYGFDLGGTNE